MTHCLASRVRTSVQITRYKLLVCLAGWQSLWPCSAKLSATNLSTSTTIYTSMMLRGDQGRTNDQRNSSGLYQPTRAQLASVNDYFTHAGLPAIRLERWRASRHERAFAYDRGAPVVSRITANDRRDMEECAGRGIIRDSPTPRRISGVGERAKRRPECGLLFPHAECIQLGMHARHAPVAICWSLSSSQLGSCQAMLVSAPVILLLLDYWPLRRSSSPP